jgi:hypothetical protein
VFEVNAATEIEEATEKASEELRGLEGLPRYLRPRILPSSLSFQLTFLQVGIDDRISDVVMKRKEELKAEFDHNCSIAYRVLANEAGSQINCLTEWNSEVEAVWLGRFCELVHYNELNENMRGFLRETYNAWVQFLTSKLHFDVRSAHDNGETALIILLLILVLVVMMIAIHCSNKQTDKVVL